MSFHLISPEQNLPRFVAGLVAAAGGNDFSRQVAVFPTARLGQHFRRELAERAGACLPPRVTTLAGLIALLSASPSGRPVTVLERNLILRSLLAKGRWRRLGPGMEGLIGDFFGELAAAGHRVDAPDVFERLAGAFEANPFGSNDYALYWGECARELAVLAEGYFAAVREKGCIDSDWTLPSPAPSGHGYERVLICGFYDAASAQIDFLKGIEPVPEYVFPADSTPAFTPVVRFAASLGHDLRPALAAREPRPLLAVLDGEGLPASGTAGLEKFKILALPSLTAEARQAKYEALAAHARGERALVVIPRRQRYVEVFSAVFSAPVSDSGGLLPVSDALARKCYADPAVQLLRALLELAVLGFGSSRLMAFSRTPGAAELLAGDGRCREGTNHRLRRFIENRFFENYSQLRDAFSHSADFDGKDDLLPALEDLHRLLPRPAGLGGLAALALKLYDRCCRVFPAGEIEAAVRVKLRQSLRQFVLLDAACPLPGKPVEHLAFLEKLVFQDEIYASPQPFRGVQLLHPMEARMVPAETLILCGMNEGQFPAPLPTRLVEEHSVRREFGLLNPDHLEELEELGFFSLVVQPRRVVLTRCAQAENEDSAESRFITRLRLAGRGYAVPEGAASRSDLRWRAAAAGRGNQAPPPPSAAFLRVSLPRRIHLNAGACEALLNCPYRFYLELKGVAEGPELKEEPDRRVEGTYLHRIVAEFWKSRFWEKRGLTAAGIEAELVGLSSRLVPRIAGFAFLRMMLQCGAWRPAAGRLAKLLAEWNPSSWEERLSSELSAGGSTFNLSGRADFLGLSAAGERIVIDFKSRSIAGKREVEDLSRPQLPFYALMLERAKKPVSRLGYCSLLGRGRPGMTEIPEGGLGARLARALKDRLAGIAAAGGVSADPDERYCAFCPYPGVCRSGEEGAGPEEGGRDD